MNARSDFWFARLCCVLSAGVTAFIASSDASSQHAYAFSADGLNGHLVVAIMGFLTLVGVVDWFLNDHLKLSGPNLRRCVHKRFLLFVAIAACNACLLYANVARSNLEPFLARYILDGALNLLLAVMLVARRYKWYASTVL